MSVFAVILDKPNPEAEKRIETEYPECFKFTETLFLVQSKSIADKVATLVGIKGEENERIQSGVVFRLNHSYAGFTSGALWDWLEQAEKQE